MKPKWNLWALLVAGLAALCFAQDDDLYPDPPPPDAAFVRVINAAPGSEVELTLGERTFPATAYGAATDYYTVRQGEKRLAGSGLETSVSVSAGKFYTVALLEQDGLSATLIEDGMNSNRAKTLLSLYNLSDQAQLDLKTADGEVEIITGVAPAATLSTEVNPISVTVGVFSGDDLLASEGLELQRGAVYSALVLGQGEDARVVWQLTETVLED